MNIREIAKLVGVSPVSVSRALNGKNPEKLSEKTRQKILKACEKHHYMPNVNMLRISNRRADNLAFLFPPGSYGGNPSGNIRMDDNLSAAILGAEEELSRSSKFLTLASISPQSIEEKQHIRFYRSKMVDGMLIWGWFAPGSYLDDFVKEGIPAVMLQSVHEKGLLSSVTPQDEEGMRLLVDHVVAAGHRRIAIARGAQTSFVGRCRLKGALAALAALGLNPSCVSEGAGFLVKDGYDACREIMAKAPETTCILAPNDFAAVGVIRAADELGLSVPGDLSVTGADGLGIFQPMELTTYDAMSYAIGRESAKLLLALLDNPEMKPMTLRLPVRFLEGRTVGAPRA